MLDRPDLPTIPAAASQAVATLAFLGPPPLLEGEREAAYNELLARISGALHPGDILEDLWIRDIVDLTWDVFRLRRLKASMIASCTGEGVKNALDRLKTPNFAELVQQWTARDAAAREKVETVLALAGQTVESVSARTLAVWVGDLERLERMITSAEGRRHAALRELERHRETLARSLRRAVADVEDAEFKVIAPEPPAQEAAA